MTKLFKTFQRIFSGQSSASESLFSPLSNFSYWPFSWLASRLSKPEKPHESRLFLATIADTSASLAPSPVIEFLLTSVRGEVKTIELPDGKFEHTLLIDSEGD